VRNVVQPWCAWFADFVGCGDFACSVVMTRVFVEEEGSFSAVEGKPRGWGDENQGMRLGLSWTCLQSNHANDPYNFKYALSEDIGAWGAFGLANTFLGLSVLRKLNLIKHWISMILFLINCCIAA